MERVAAVRVEPRVARSPERRTVPAARWRDDLRGRGNAVLARAALQRKLGFEYELDSIRTRHTNSYAWTPRKHWVQHDAGDRLQRRNRYDITADIARGYSRIEFVTDAFDEATELPALIQVINDIEADIAAIRLASLRHQAPGYLARTRLGGQEGWLPRDRWIGLDQIPRLGGDWRQQVEYAARPNALLVGQLQMTAGFNLPALQKLVSGDHLGNVLNWRRGWGATPRQYVTAYARGNTSSELYRRSLRAATTHRVAGDDPAAARIIASVLSVMAQGPIAHRGGTVDTGLLIAKSNYAQILTLAERETGRRIRPRPLVLALLEIVNGTLGRSARNRVREDDPVFPGDAQINLGKVSFTEWTEALLPKGPLAQRAPKDLMTRQHYPGTPDEKTAIRAFGPYDRVDPGERAIFELRSMTMNTVTDLRPLVQLLTAMMVSINHRPPQQQQRGRRR